LRSHGSAVIVSLRVQASPARAFRVFTEEIGVWWRPHALFPVGPRGPHQLRFEPGVDGRLVAAAADGEIVEIGRIIDWAPGERLAFTWRPNTFAPDQVTTVEVRFHPVGAETRVTVEHRGWDAIPPRHAARHGFPLDVFQLRLAEYWRSLLAALSAGMTPTDSSASTSPRQGGSTS
jgi:uncharacterized protein YndB with AHSA1/START domain